MIYLEALFQSVFNVLGETLARLQQDEEAESWYRAALDAQPDHVPAHITYGKLLAKNVSITACYVSIQFIMNHQQYSTVHSLQV